MPWGTGAGGGECGAPLFISGYSDAELKSNHIWIAVRSAMSSRIRIVRSVMYTYSEEGYE